MATEPSRTVEVKTPRELRQQSFVEAVQDHFSKAEHGGRSIKEINTQEDRGIIQITYASCAAARDVTKVKHEINGHKVDVKLLSPCYPDKLLFRNVPSRTSADKLKKFVKKVTGFEAADILYGETVGNVVVTLSGEPDVFDVEEKCHKKTLEKTTVTVEKIPISTCVLVEDLPAAVTPDRLVSYFERKVGYGVVDRRRVIPLRRTESTGFYVYFREAPVVQEILKQEHVIDGHPVTTKLFLPCLGPSGGSTGPPEPVFLRSRKTGVVKNGLNSLRGSMTLGTRKKRRSTSDPGTFVKSESALLKENENMSSAPHSREPSPLMISKQKCKVTETLKPIHIRLLKAGEIPQDIKHLHKDLLIKIKQHGISFIGCQQDTIEAQVEIHNLLQCLKTETVSLTEGQKELMKHPQAFSYMEQKLKDRELLVEFEINTDGDLDVWAFNQPDVDRALETIRASLSEILFSFEEDTFAVLQSSDWKRLSKELHRSHAGKLVVHNNSSAQVLVTATDDVMHDVTERVTAFQQEYAFLTETVRFSRFVEQFLQKELSSIVDKELKHHDLQLFGMVSREGKEEDESHIHGTRKGIHLFKERLRVLEEKVHCHKQHITEPRKVCFLGYTESRTLLEQLEADYKCILSLQPDVNHVGPPNCQCRSAETTGTAGDAYTREDTGADLYIYHSGPEKTAREVLKALDSRIPHDFQTKTVERETVKRLEKRDKEEIQAICQQLDVVLRLDTAHCRYTVSGEGSRVNEAREKIDDILHRVDNRLINDAEVKLTRVSQPILPENWMSHSHGDELVRKVPLRASDGEYRQVEANFRKTLGTKPVVVSMIHRIQNRTRYQQYMAQKAHMDRQNVGLENERTLWHGTGPEAIDSIVHYGFDRGYCGKNAKKYGEGVYFAVESSYSAFSFYSRPDAADNRHVFQCKVLVGHSVVGKERMKVLPERAMGVLYDSATDSLEKPTLYVIFGDNNAYPEYLITFRVTEPRLS